LAQGSPEFPFLLTKNNSAITLEARKMFRLVLIAPILARAAGLNAAQGQGQESSYSQSQTDQSMANPVRKVVTMLQMMTNKIEAEAKKEKALYDKFMCYCATADTDLSASIEDANTKIPQLESDIKESTEEKARLEGELTAHMSDRDAAKTAMMKATAIREKEHAAFLKEEESDMSNIDALTKAIKAISDGMAGGFVQTNDAAVLRRLSVSKADMLDVDRQALVSFLTTGRTLQEDGSPGSAEILGILKTMLDEMQKDLSELQAQEATSAQNYEELMAAKKKEVETHSAAIESKMTRVGELGVSIAMMKNDLEDSKEGLNEDSVLLRDLGKTCASKTKEWEEMEAERKQELIALAETIKILNDDDALDLFKKTLPSASLLQVDETTSAMRNRALRILKAARSDKAQKPQPIDFIELALHGKQMGFAKVIKLIDDMVVTLKKEQVEDDHKKEYCEEQFDIADDKKKELERAISDTEKEIAEVKDSLATVTEEISTLEGVIAELDKSVAVATHQRKDEHEDFTILMANNKAAKELILFAKNRMQKFYNPKLYKPPPKRELSEEERITLNMGGTLAPTEAPGGIAGTGISFAQVHVHITKKMPPPPAVSFVGKKSEEAGGVLAMMDLLVKEVDKEMTTAEVEEKDAQSDYEKLMKESSDKRAADSKTLTEKTAMKAEMETELQSHTEKKEADSTELRATKDYINTLHSDCDFLLEYYDQRKTARASEIDALGKAKAVLSGADYSLMQTGARLRGLH